MAHTIKVRRGGSAGAAYTDFTAQVPVFDEPTAGGVPNALITGGAAYGNVTGKAGKFVVIDDIGEIPKADGTKNLPGHTEVQWIENAPGFDCVISYGRIGSKEWSRGDHPWDDSRTASVSYDDLNSDFKLMDLTASWVRAAESGRARVLAALAAFADGSPRVTVDYATHFVAAGNEVTMPAKTYPAGTGLHEILTDCATTEGKHWGPVIHHLAGVSHKCFLYILPEDHTTYASTVTISDVPAEIAPEASPPTIAPSWERDASSIEEGQVRPISHVIVKYGTGDDSFVVVANSARVAQYDYAAITINDSQSESAVQATARGEAYLAEFAREHVTHQVSLFMRANQVNLICAGMSINIKSAASMGGIYLDTVQTRRIAAVEWEPVAPEVGAVVGWYWAHLDLERPAQLPIGGPVGPKPPSGPTAASCASDVDQMTAVSTPNGDLETGLLTNWTMSHISGELRTDGDGALGTTHWYQLNGAGYALYEGFTGTTFLAGQKYVARFYTREYAGGAGGGEFGFGVSGVDEYLAPSVGSGTGWELHCIEWTPTANRAGADVYFAVSAGSLDNFNIDQLQVYTGGSGTTTEPIGGNDEGDTGDDLDTQTPIDHVHAHSDLSDHDTETHHHASSIEFTPTGTIAATNVQTGMAEIATDYAAADSTHAAAADPHTGYQRESEKSAANGYASLDGTTKVPIAELPTGTTSTTVSLGDHEHASSAGELLISDTPSTPLIFADLIQNEAQDDLVYAD